MQGFRSILSALTAPRIRAHPALAALAGATAGGRSPGAPSTRETLRIGVTGVRHVARTAPPAPVAPTNAVEPIADEEIALFEPAPAEPHGVRVVPYRPTSTWPEERRVHPRVYDPFRAFPNRAALLAEIMHTDDGRP